MITYTCDRCGEPVKLGANSDDRSIFITALVRGDTNAPTPFAPRRDLCAVCVGLFWQFLTNKEANK